MVEYTIGRLECGLCGEVVLKHKCFVCDGTYHVETDGLVSVDRWFCSIRRCFMCGGIPPANCSGLVSLCASPVVKYTMGG